MIQIRDFKTDHYQTYIPINSTKKFFKKEDIMIGRYGPPNFQILRGLEGAYNVALMKAIPTKTGKNYLYYFLKQKTIFNIIDSLAKRTAGQDGVELDVLRRLPFPLPPKEEEEKIATILSNVDNLIESTEKVITHSKKVKKGLMQKLLTRGIGHTKFKKVNLLPSYLILCIPDEWDSTSLSSIVQIKGRIGWRGYTVNDLRDSGPLVIGATQISKQHVIDLSKPTYISKEKYDESPEIQLTEDNILIVKTGNTVGKTALIDNTLGDATINPNVCVLKNIKINSKFLYYILLTDIIQYLLKIHSLESSAQPAINQKTIQNLIIPIPPLPEQQKIATILSNMDSKITSQEQYKEKLQKLKKSLMQKLLTGEVRV
jgi:type I restriction enzyme S subunit